MLGLKIRPGKFQGSINTVQFWFKTLKFHYFRFGSIPLQNCFGCSRFAAYLQQICCRQICSQERRIFVRRCLQLAAIFLWSFLRHTCCKHMSAGRLQKTMLHFPAIKKIFAGGLQETLNNSEMFTGNLREFSTIKIVCRKLTEILNKHIFNLMSHFNAV